MDEIAVVASALVAAMATDAWHQAREGLVALWRRVRPERAEEISGELEALHTQVLNARTEEDPAEMLQALETTWRIQLRALLRHDPQATGELRRILDEELAPALEPGERQRVYSVVQNTTVHGGTGIAVGRDYHEHRDTTAPKA
ncbi:hypothetical protein [Streptomyces katsurahamanus]|uniref:Uncharacterized protein n=1 Tax=Streptomyces katsurahamanus TaxID=2577098 RepID=A0ABW9NWS3_9ACTN|nr:hypothetical protein [Streptomyces katsurahamanus]MQS37720.1 hypothetical protein [Streptomyces katsurahamanus]